MVTKPGANGVRTPFASIEAMFGSEMLHVTGTFGAHWEMDGVAIAQPETPLMFISASTLRDLLNEVGRMIDELS